MGNICELWIALKKDSFRWQYQTFLFNCLLWIELGYINISWKNLPKSPNAGWIKPFLPSFASCSEGGRGRLRLEIPERFRKQSISCSGGSASVLLRVIASSPPSISDNISIMVDILLLMFFAIMGLVFLSYIIYLLWWWRRWSVLLGHTGGRCTG